MLVRPEEVLGCQTQQAASAFAASSLCSLGRSSEIALSKRQLAGALNLFYSCHCSSPSKAQGPGFCPWMDHLCSGDSGVSVESQQGSQHATQGSGTSYSLDVKLKSGAPSVGGPASC